MASIIPQKTCTKCGKPFPQTAEFFTRDKNKPDGLFSWCKSCKSANDKYYAGLPEAKERDRLRRQTPEFMQQRRDYMKAMREDPILKEVIRERKRSPRARELERQRKKLTRNSHKRIVHNVGGQRRRARQRNLPSNFSAKDWQCCLEYFNHQCAVCGRPQGLWHTIAQDHWIPLTSPDCIGTVPKNIVPLCHGIDGCNNKKGGMMPEEWLATRFTKSRINAILKRINGYFQWLN